MQKYDCSLCRGRKCFMHGGETEYKCKYCGKEKLCSDCHNYAKCCLDFENGVWYLKKDVKYITLPDKVY